MKSNKRDEESQIRVSSNAEERLEVEAKKAGLSDKTDASAFVISDCFDHKLASALSLDTLETSVGSEVLNGFSERKRASGRMSERFERFDSHRAERMRDCGYRLIEERASGKSRFRMQAFRCYDRFCPNCSHVRSGRLVNTLGEALLAFQKANGLFSYLLTVTFKDTDELRPFSEMSKQFKKLMSRKEWKAYGLVGGLRSFEVVKGQGSGMWHSHFHAILFTSKPIPCYVQGSWKGQWLHEEFQQGLEEAWLKITGDSFVLKGKEFDGRYAEVIKYITKGVDVMSDEDLKTIACYLKGKRQLSLFGVCYDNEQIHEALKKQDEDLELDKVDENGNEWLPYCEWRFDYNAESFVPYRLIGQARHDPPVESMSI